MKKFIVIISLALSMFNARVHYGQSLEAYIAQAEENNPGLKAKLEEFEAAMQKIPQVSSLPDPTFSVSAFGQMVETRVGQQMARLSLSQMFPWFGTLAAQKNAAALAAEAKYQSYLDARNELRFRVRSAYYPLFELEEKIRLQKENLNILSTYKTLATTKFQNGSGKLADALRVDIMTSDLETEIEILESRKKPLLVAFNTLLNRAVDDEIITEGNTQLTALRSFTLDSVLTNNPKLEEIEQRIAAAQAQEAVAVKQGLPKMGLGFEYIVTTKRPGMDFQDNGKDAYMPMLTVSLPVYRKKYRAAVNESRHMQQSFTEMKREVENRLTTQYETALFERDKANSEYNLFEQQIGKTKQIIELLLSGYGNSGTDFEEILRMQQMLLKYEVSKISSIREYFIAEAKLLYLVANRK